MESSSTEICLFKQVESQELTASRFGFKWTDIKQILEQIRSECNEVQEAHKNGDFNHLQEEIGDLIQATICLSIYCQFDPHETLSKAIKKFQLRYDRVVSLAKEDGWAHLQGKPEEFLLEYWRRAKEAEKEKE